MTDYSAELLTKSIILQACSDYTKALKTLEKSNDMNTMIGRNRIIGAQATIDDVERFLRSEWFKTLTDIDGEIVLRELKLGHKNRNQYAKVMEVQSDN